MMLAERGYGANADEVMRKALALLERQIEARKL
jgi:Arc/MetJ-type ribon-helix-helix transcriptional regulator